MPRGPLVERSAGLGERALLTEPAARAALTPRVLVAALRPRQWVKNGLLFIGLVFALRLGDERLALTAALAFVAFCALSSAGYLVNDVLDAGADRLHPTKRLRPVASGALQAGAALGLAGLLGLGGLALALRIGAPFLVVALVYVAITAGYSLGLKHLVLIDAFAIAAGFVVRAAAGAVAIGVPISPWLYVCTGLAALFIALSKRRSELGLLGDGAAAGHRRNLEQYSAELLDQLITVVLAVTVMAYTLYTFTAENLPPNHAMMLTVPVVLYALFRYLYLARQGHQGGSPEEVLLRDRPLLATAGLWLILSVAILYAAR